MVMQESVPSTGNRGYVTSVTMSSCQLVTWLRSLLLFFNPYSRFNGHGAAGKQALHALHFRALESLIPDVLLVSDVKVMVPEVCGLLESIWCCSDTPTFW